MTTFVQRVDARIRNVRPGQWLKTVVGWPFWLLGWLVGRALRGLQWLAEAVAVGFADGKSE